MDFERKVPEWYATGSEPPTSLKTNGFQSGYKPPAGYFNWFWNRVSTCLAELQAKLKMAYRNASLPTVAATSTDGVAYTATVEGVTELYNGLTITVIPNMTSTNKAITLNVNGLGAKMVRVALSFNNAAMSTPKLDSYYTEGRPLTLQYDANYLAGDGIWKTVGKERTSAQDLYGTVPVDGGGTGATTAEEARANLGVLAASDFKFTSAPITLAANKWATDDNAVSTLTVGGLTITADKVPLLELDTSVMTGDNAADLIDAFAMIGRITSGAGSVTLYTYGVAPDIDLPVIVRWL